MIGWWLGVMSCVWSWLGWLVGIGGGMEIVCGLVWLACWGCRWDGSCVGYGIIGEYWGVRD